MEANIFNIQHFSLHDGPGIRTVVFLKGCPLNCAWCHNPESKKGRHEIAFYDEKCVKCGKCVNVCPQMVHRIEDNEHKINRTLCKACGKCVKECEFAAIDIFGNNCSIEDIMKEISKDDIFFADGGGVTISGGEPFLQFDALYELVLKCKQRNYSVCIETCGYTDGEKIKKIAAYVDWFLYDCKETDAQNHLKYTGVSNKLILDNLYLLDKISANVILRCPVIPYVNDRSEHFENIGKLANQHSCIKYIELMKYHPLGLSKAKQIGAETEYDNSKFLDKSTAEKFAKIIRMTTKKPVKVT